MLLLNLCRFAFHFDAITLSITAKFFNYVTIVLTLTRLFENNRKFTPFNFQVKAITIPVYRQHGGQLCRAEDNKLSAAMAPNPK
jgi:hypothetical protein